MDSSYFLMPSNNNMTTTANNNINLNQQHQSCSSSSSSPITSAGSLSQDHLEQSPASPFNYDPFDGFTSILDQQQSLRLYDYFGCASSDRNSPLSMNQTCPIIDQLADLAQQKNFSFPSDPNQDEDDDLHITLTSFDDTDLGVDIDAGYNSGADLFSSNNLFDRPHNHHHSHHHHNNSHHNHHNHQHQHLNHGSTSQTTDDAYYLKLSIDSHPNHNHNNSSNISSSSSSSCSSMSSNSIGYVSCNESNMSGNNSSIYSDINNNYNCNNSLNNHNNFNNSYDCNNSYTTKLSSSSSSSSTSNSDNDTSQTTTSSTTTSTITTTKRSVLMNLLIDGSDVGAGYTSHNFRALPLVRKQQRSCLMTAPAASSLSAMINSQV